MDASGLYYYGARYYAPWLQRWISADPAGDVDGLNLYEMVGSNPVAFIDSDGQGRLSFLKVETPEQYAQRKAQSTASRQQYAAKEHLSKQIDRHLNILGLSLRRGLDAQQQILNHRSTSELAASATRRSTVHVMGQVVAYGGGALVGIAAQSLAAVAPGAGNVVGAMLGFGAKKLISLLWDYAAERTGASASVKFKASRLSVEKIVRKSEYKTISPANYIKQRYAKMWPNTRKGAGKATKEVTNTTIGVTAKAAIPQAANEISATANALLGAVEIAHEIIGASSELSAEKIEQGITNLDGLINYLAANMMKVENAFEAAGVSAMHTFSYFGERVGDTVQNMWQTTSAVMSELEYTRTILRSKSSQFTAV
jgi:insecticidal toxin complex protein TccC